MKTETITCCCGTEFQWTNESGDKWIAKLLRPHCCSECEERRESELLEKNRLEREQRLASLIAHMCSRVAKETPRLFHRTDIHHERFNAAGWARLKNWRPSTEKPWLGIIGETGTCKSRIACLLAAAEMDQQVERRVIDSANLYPDLPMFHFVSCYEISDFAALLQAGTFDQKEEARRYLDAIRRADLLVIDDLGKGRMNAAIAAEMFALFDHRYANALTTIWTANSTPEQISSSLPEDMAGPFAGRINDSSRILRFK